MASSKQQNFEDKMNKKEYNDEIYESGEEVELESTMPNVNKTIEENSQQFIRVKQQQQPQPQQNKRKK